jgi:hypothetical protein
MYFSINAKNKNQEVNTELIPQVFGSSVGLLLVYVLYFYYFFFFGSPSCSADRQNEAH